MLRLRTGYTLQAEEPTLIRLIETWNCVKELQFLAESKLKVFSIPKPVQN